MTRFVIALLLSLFSLPCLANQVLQGNINEQKQPDSRSDLSSKMTYGHNMSSNSYTLHRGDCVLGPYLVACGITDNLTVGTSTWLAWGYNSYSAALRYADNFNSSNRLGIQLLYLDSFKPENNNSQDGLNYQMESLRSQIILTSFHNSILTTHLNLTYEYFFDETFAHSYRRNPLNDQPYQVSLTLLSEFNINSRYTVQGEIGGHGLNYLYPQLYTGFSFVYKTKKSAFQAGLSINGTFQAYFSGGKIDTQGRFLDNRGTTLTNGIREPQIMQNDFDVHPEFQWNYYF